MIKYHLVLLLHIFRFITFSYMRCQITFVSLISVQTLLKCQPNRCSTINMNKNEGIVRLNIGHFAMLISKLLKITGVMKLYVINKNDNKKHPSL